jgi:hypothetical protein
MCQYLRFIWSTFQRNAWTSRAAVSDMDSGHGITTVWGICHRRTTGGSSSRVASINVNYSTWTKLLWFGLVSRSGGGWDEFGWRQDRVGWTTKDAAWRTDTAPSLAIGWSTNCMKNGIVICMCWNFAGGMRLVCAIVKTNGMDRRGNGLIEGWSDVWIGCRNNWRISGWIYVRQNELMDRLKDRCTVYGCSKWRDRRIAKYAWMYVYIFG